MNKTIQYLAIAFIVQCLILGTVLFGKNSSSLQERSRFLEFDATSIDSLTIKDAQGELFLKKENGLWLLPDYGNLPIVTGKVEGVLDDLSALTVSWPIASSESAAKRFEVDMDNAQKSIKLKMGNEIIANMYLGTSPGYRKVHARNSDSDDIYAIEFSQHQISNKYEDWFDKGILQYDGELSKVSVDSLTAIKANDVWSIENYQEEVSLSPEKIAAWAKRFNNIQVSKLIEGTDKERVIVMDPVLTVNLEGNQGSSSLVFFKKDDKTYVKKAGDEALFEIAGFQADPIMNAGITDFQAEDATLVN